MYSQNIKIRHLNIKRNGYFDHRHLDEEPSQLSSVMRTGPIDIALTVIPPRMPQPMQVLSSGVPGSEFTRVSRDDCSLVISLR